MGDRHGMLQRNMYQKHLSDHAILSMHVSFKEVCQHEAGKISEVVFRHPKFSIYHELLCHAVKLDSISDPWTRLDYHKAIILHLLNLYVNIFRTARIQLHLLFV